MSPHRRFLLRNIGPFRHPSAFLLGAQLLSLILYAVFDRAQNGRVLLGAAGVLVLVMTVWVVYRSSTVNWIAWVLGAPALLLLIGSELSNNAALLVWAALLEAILYFYAAVSLIVYMMDDTRVTTDELFAAGATFTLLAWGFTYLYIVCQAWVPGSFSGTTHPGQAWSLIELMSLSFANLSATGLSDIVPVSAPARVLVMLEQFSGILYLAMVVSRLIGMSMARQGRKQA